MSPWASATSANPASTSSARSHAGRSNTRLAGPNAFPSMDALIGWLPHHVPPGDETSIVHGDFRLDNVIFHPTEPRVLGVLDWELATLGHPLSDFAYQVMAWRLAPGQFRGLK